MFIKNLEKLSVENRKYLENTVKVYLFKFNNFISNNTNKNVSRESVKEDIVKELIYDVKKYCSNNNLNLSVAISFCIIDRNFNLLCGWRSYSLLKDNFSKLDKVKANPSGFYEHILNSRTFEDIFANKNDTLIFELSQYKDFFPSKTIKYFDTKVKELKKSCSITQISNTFELRMFENSLSENYSKTNLKAMFNNFKKSLPDNESTIKQKTLFLFIVGVFNKYGNESVTLVEELIVSFLNLYTNGLRKSEGLNELYNFLYTNFNKYDYMIKHLFIKVLQDRPKHNFFIFLFEEFELNDSTFNIYKKIINSHLSKKFEYEPFFKFNSMLEENKKKLFDIYKSEYLKEKNIILNK